MKYRPLGVTGLKVSVIGLGTMTWGEQNSEAEAHAQLDYALAQGVTLIDTAEMYPAPPRAETQGRTEEYIGRWLDKTGKRSQLVLASKVTGPGDFPYLRGGTRLDRASVIQACEASLRRLQTHYLDLYQVHWPQRPTNYFGRLGYEMQNAPVEVPIEETLDALAELVRQGKVRYVGVSNETPWGLAEYLRLHREQGLPRVASIQNPYNLLNRSFEVGLAEFAHREHVSLIAYSPLAFGVLSGKYLDGARPPEARVTRFSRFSRYSGEQAQAAVEEYASLAWEQGLNPAQMALAYVASRPFVSSLLVAATTLDQLAVDIGSVGLELPAEALAGIEAIHRRHPNPAP